MKVDTREKLLDKLLNPDAVMLRDGNLMALKDFKKGDVISVDMTDYARFKRGLAKDDLNSD